jgi:DnaJ-domain-containing protein 1
MSSAKQNKSIARLIVGAMSIDGQLDKKERLKVASALESLGMAELIADVGAAIEEDPGDFNMFQECDELLASLGSIAPDVSPLIFRIVADVVASDRFVSAQEATYLGAMAKKLKLSSETAQAIFKQVMADRHGRLEISGSSVNENFNPYLKELLSFAGADYLVGKNYEDIEENPPEAPAEDLSQEEIDRAYAVLGLAETAGMREAEKVWRETIDHLDLPKMADLGETFVSAAINRITRINEAYKVVLKRFGKAEG